MAEPEKPLKYTKSTVPVAVLDVPLTVTGAARRLGVSASTLRSWEQRYGLTLSSHTPGTQRLYSAADMFRLERMCRLIADGVRPAQAAELVRTTGQSGDCVGIDPQQVQADDLVEILLAGHFGVLREILEGIIEYRTLTGAWNDVIEPAVWKIVSQPAFSRPGEDAVAILTSHLMAIFQEINALASPSLSHFQTVILTDRAWILSAHFLAAALCSKGVGALVACMFNGGSENEAVGQLQKVFEIAESKSVEKASNNTVESTCTVLVAVTRNLAANEEIIAQLAKRPNVRVLLMGQRTEAFTRKNVGSVRTTVAALLEIVEMAKHAS